MPRRIKEGRTLQKEGRWEALLRAKTAGDPWRWLNRQQAHCSVIISSQTCCCGHLKWVRTPTASSEPSGIDPEGSTWLNQDRKGSWQITVLFVIISELGKCLSLKESILGGERAVFLETPGWVIYFKWAESLFMLAPPQNQWTVYLHEARRCCHFFQSIYHFEQLYLAAWSDSFTTQAKSSTQGTSSNPTLALLPSMAWPVTPFKTFPHKFCLLRHNGISPIL